MNFSFRVLLNGGDEEKPASKTDMETKESFLNWGHLRSSESNIDLPKLFSQ